MVEDPRQPGEPAPPPPQPEHPSVRREGTDVSFRWVIGSIILALCFAAWVHIILLVFHNSYARYEKDIKKSPYPLTQELPKPDVADLPPEPRLEELNRFNEVQKSNVYERQASREQILESYGPTRRRRGTPTSPSTRRSSTWPASCRRAAPADRFRQNGLVDGGESNSGRMFREEPLWSER